MRPSVPIFHPGTRAPARPRRGLALLGPPGERMFAEGPQWLHGALVVDREPDPAGRERWARSLFLTAFVEAGTYPSVVSFLGAHHLLGDPVREEPGEGGPVWVIPFQVDLAEHLGLPRRAGRHHVQVSARTWRSPVLALTCEPGAPPDVAKAVFGEAAPRTPADALVLASTLARLGWFDEALARFEEALADPALRGDLDRGCLYQAACTAARAAAASEEGRQGLVARAIEWLAEDLELRRQVLQERLVIDFHADVARQLTDERRATFEPLRAALVAHFRMARDDDPDLAVLRARAVDDLMSLVPAPVGPPSAQDLGRALGLTAVPGPAEAASAAASSRAPAPTAAAAERLSTARRRAAEIRARLRARIDDLRQERRPAGSSGSV